MSRTTSVCVCLSVSNKSRVCMWLSKEVNTEIKKSLILLAVLCECDK